MRYPIAIESGDPRHADGVVVLDLPGCFSAGDTLEAALVNAREAVLLHMEGLLDDGMPVPRSTSIGTSYSRRLNTKCHSLAPVLSGFVVLLCAGCVTDGARQEAAYERNIQRTTTALLAAGDADSLAAAALQSA